MASHVRGASKKDPIELISYKDAKVVAASFRRVCDKAVCDLDASVDGCG
jgi:hypothetical protein